MVSYETALNRAAEKFTTKPLPKHITPAGCAWALAYTYGSCQKKVLEDLNKKIAKAWQFKKEAWKSRV